GGVLGEGAGAPDLLAAAMPLAVVAGPDAVAVPQAVGGGVDQAGAGLRKGVLVPGAVLGEGLQGLPVAGAAAADEGRGEGVSRDVASQAGQPFLEAAAAVDGEGVGTGVEAFLPVGPALGSLQEAPPVFRGVRGVVIADIRCTGAALGYPGRRHAP